MLIYVSQTIALLCHFRCVTGNLAEIVLSPVFSHRASIFGCHIEPVPKYKIYDIEYTVLKPDNKPINDKRLRAKKLYEGHHPAKTMDM